MEEFPLRVILITAGEVMELAWAIMKMEVIGRCTTMTDMEASTSTMKDIITGVMDTYTLVV